MAYLAPSEFVTKMVDAGESKIFMSTRDTVVRAYMAGAVLRRMGFSKVSYLKGHMYRWKSLGLSLEE